MSNHESSAPKNSEALRRIAEAKKGQRDELDLSGLGLTEIPEQIAELTWLKTLYAGSNTRSNEDGRVKLSVTPNVIQNLPLTLNFLTELQQLDLTGNQLSSLPTDIWRLKSLQSLSLDSNQLTALPAGIGKLKSLQSLSLDHNQLAELPVEVCQLSSLQRLSLDHNQLAALPAEIGQLTSLQSLSLNGNRLAALPAEIGELRSLRRLSLDRNQLTTLTPEVGQLALLVRFSSRYNQLSTLPSELGLLSSLEFLYVDGNDLSALPQEIGELKALRSITLSDNKFTVFPKVIGSLTTLRFISADNNKITALPDEIGQLATLQYLHIDNNEIHVLPVELGKLAELQSLMLGSNKLTTIPEQLGRLAALTDINVNNNPLTSPPNEVVRQGTKALVAFLREIMADGQPLYEAKIILVGEGAVGKTTLRNWILEDRYIEPGTTTRALELGSREFTHAFDPKQSLRLNIWDFGGQEEYRPSQQFFFSKGALYLLLWKGRLGIAQGRVEEWLRLIRLRAGKDARVLMIATHMGPNDPQPSLGALPDDLRRMALGPFAVDNHVGAGVTNLITQVREEVARLPGFAQKWPRRWLAARDAVLQHRPDGLSRFPSFISYETFLELCKPYGVEGYNAQILAGILSLQGRLDYHGDGRDPNQLVIMSPEWLMKAVAYVIADRDVIQNNGILRRERLGAIWLNHKRSEVENPEYYAPHLWPSLLRLMAQHEIIYQLTENEWIVAQLVPEVAPPEIPWTISDGPGSIRLQCDLSDKIRGLMSLLIVRSHYHHVDFKRHFWQRGVFLRNPHTAAEALVTVDGEDKIRIEVRGFDANGLMAELAGSLERLVYETWPGTEQDREPPFKYFIPCPTPKCQGRFGRRDLIADLHQQVDTARCEGGGRHAHDIRALLHGVGLPSADRKLDRIIERISKVHGQVSSEPPRIISIESVKRTVKSPQILGRTIRIQIYCEVLRTPVAGAVEAVSVPKEWWRAVKPWIPFVASAGSMLAAGFGIPMPADSGLGDAYDAAREVLKKDEHDVDRTERHGVLERPDGVHVPAAFAEKLIQIAKKGGMSQVQMDSDGRWVWVSKKVAERNDRTIAKERVEPGTKVT